MSGSPNPTPSTPVRLTAGLAFKRRYRPYFTKRQLSTLNSLKRSVHGPSSKEPSARIASCKFIQQLCRKVGFPESTMSTAQALYHRFYLFYSIREYPPQEVSIACTFVASKIEETSKSLKDILVAVHSVRYPTSVELDPEQVSEERRRRIIGYEKLLMETICFDFQQPHPYEYVVKFVKWIQQARQDLDGKQLARKAYHLAVESYQTALCVEYPAHTIAAGCILLASKILKLQDVSFAGLEDDHPWDQFFCSRMEDIDDICLQVLDLIISAYPEHERENYTAIKIDIHKQAEKRGNDPNMDPITSEELTSRTIDWEFDRSPNPLEVVNTNQHSVSYEFSLISS
ncbi:cyclin-like protein [Dichotomocladium elegans]|nr:cyclin-like protein [Dichotomocladium elegans]